jgi:RAQPRD family integrative conjugative element protein
MKNCKHRLVCTTLLSFILAPPLTLANTAQMHTTLSRINIILNQINPLINLAQAQEDPNARVKFQFKQLRQDVTLIQSGIAQALNRVSIQPRIVAPLAGDYLPPYSSSRTKKITTTSNENTP